MKPHNLNRSERGAVIVQVVIAILVIFGFVALSVDYGAMTVRQRQLQGATDAGALAAGQSLSVMVEGETGTAQDIARQYATTNGATNASAVINMANHTLTVTAWEAVPTPFFGVVNSAKKTHMVSARSVIEVFPAMSMSSLRSICVKNSFINLPANNNYFEVPGKIRLVMDPLTKGEGNGAKTYYDYPDKPGDTTAPPEMWVVPANLTKATSFAGQMDDYMVLMKGGFAGPLYTIQRGQQETNTWLDIIYNENANVWNPTVWATNTAKAVATAEQGGDPIVNGDLRSGSVMEQAKIWDAAHKGPDGQIERWDNYSSGNPRLMLLPVVDRSTGQQIAKLKGFMAFFLESTEWNATEFVMNGRFLRQTRRWDGTKPEDQIDPGSYAYGVFSYRLID